MARKSRKQKHKIYKRSGIAGPRTLARIKKVRIARRLAIVGSMVLILTFVVKEIVGQNLKDLRDSLVSAEQQFHNEESQSLVSFQLLTLQQQIEKLQRQDKQQPKTPTDDYSAEIRDHIIKLNQVQSRLDVDFSNVSSIIDNLPMTAYHLRKARDDMRVQVIEKVDNEIKDLMIPSPRHDLPRLIQLMLGRILALSGELPVIILADSAVTAAERLEKVAEKILRMCDWIFYILGVGELGLGFYAAIAGIKLEDSVREPE